MKHVIGLFFIVLLYGCGSGGGGSDLYSDNTIDRSNTRLSNSPPIITPPSGVVATNEGSTAVTTVVAMDPNHDVPLTYKLEGNSTSATDHTLFDISSSGVITYKTAPTYITKNSYSITAVVSDQFTSTKQDINIAVNIPPFAWKISTPTAEGMDATKLQVALDYAFEDNWNTQGLIIIKDGKIVAEQYQGISDASVTGLKRIAADGNGSWSTGWDDAKYETVFGTRDASSIGISNSSAKTILGLIIGIAIDNGSINSLDDKVSQYITSWVGTTKEDITLKDVITMRSGLAAIPETVGLLGSHTLLYPSDGLAVSLARDLNPDPPENKFRYDGMGDTLILGEVLRVATGKDTLEYGKDNLFTKMGLENYDWWKDEAGTVMNGLNFESTLRDLLKFGLLWSKDAGLDPVYGENVIGDGRWNGEQLVSSSWIADAKTPAVVTSWSNYVYYGYLMYKATKLVSPAHLDNKELTVDVYSAKGFNDNSIWTIPEHNLIVARHGLYHGVVNIGNEKITTGDITGCPATANMDNANYIITLYNGARENTCEGYKYYEGGFAWDKFMNDEHMLMKIIESIN